MHRKVPMGEGMGNLTFPRLIHRSVLWGGLLMLLGGCATIEPVNVAGGVYFDQLCARSHAIYTVPPGKLLIIEDASASAFDSSTASILNDPGIIDDVPIHLSLRTNPTGTIKFGSADHDIVSGVGLPISGGRTMRAYAAPETEVLFLIGRCTVKVNTSVWFSGRLVDLP